MISHDISSEPKQITTAGALKELKKHKESAILWRGVNDIIISKLSREERYSKNETRELLLDKIGGVVGNRLDQTQIFAESFNLIEPKVLNQVNFTIPKDNTSKFNINTLNLSIDYSGKDNWLYHKKKYPPRTVEVSSIQMLEAQGYNLSITKAMLRLRSALGKPYVNSAEPKFLRILFKEAIKKCSVEEIKSIIEKKSALESKIAPIHTTAIKAESVFRNSLKKAIQWVRTSWLVSTPMKLVWLIGSLIVAFKVQRIVINLLKTVIASPMMGALLEPVINRTPLFVLRTVTFLYNNQGYLFLISIFASKIQSGSRLRNNVWVTRAIKAPRVPFNIITLLPIQIFFHTVSFFLRTPNYLNAVIVKTEESLTAAEKNKINRDLEDVEKYWVSLAMNPS